MLIVLDGPAASGKGTLAQHVARHYGLPHLDTGLLYRAVAWTVLHDGGDLNDAAAAARAAAHLALGSIPEADLRTAAMSEAASVVAVHPAVRQALLELQRNFASLPMGAVLDGRDMGTVVCPHADVKIFVTARPEVRARRRFEEARARGEVLTYETCLERILTRDARDSSRKDAPLKPAADALLLDTSQMSKEEAFQAARGLIDRAAQTCKTG